MTDQALRDIDALGSSSTAARFIVVYENSGEVANVITIADGDNWPPPFIGTFQIEDNAGKYNIGDYYATELSEALRRARRHDTTGKEVVD